ncbi:MAG: ABC transporter permease [Propionibacteriaceae bacterium]|jgi:peptide/nickel transport system permease protein|nr:ABC transporter permease [Propionibacteriaceae bacterium]
MAAAARKLGVFALSLLLASVLIFAVLNALPGSVAHTILGVDATPEAVAALEARLGLDRPWPVRYVEWMAGMLTGDFGTSPLNGHSVLELIGPGIPVTAWLVGLGIIGSILIALPLGMVAALRRRSWEGVAISAAAELGMAVPVFWGGIILALVFAIELRWLPPNGYVPFTTDAGEWLRHMVLPVGTLALVQAAVLTRYVRSAFIEVLTQDYYRTARALGWTPLRALFRHGVRNAAMSLVTVVGLQLSASLVGAIVVERVFNLHGLGSILIDNVFQRDIAVVQATVMLLVLAVLVINLVVDLSYGLIDPRQRGRR